MGWERERRERRMEGKVVLKRGRRTGRLAERMPMLHSTFSQMLGLVRESVGLERGGLVDVRGMVMIDKENGKRVGVG